MSGKKNQILWVSWAKSTESGLIRALFFQLGHSSTERAGEQREPSLKSIHLLQLGFNSTPLTNFDVQGALQVWEIDCLVQNCTYVFCRAYAKSNVRGLET